MFSPLSKIYSVLCMTQPMKFLMEFYDLADFDPPILFFPISAGFHNSDGKQYGFRQGPDGA